ncbi:MAG: tRNA 2-thiocytidine biosynthesis protein TtcA [Helicobacteraceae bacterium]|jgi:tRNA(Ile)-lysidine synthase TilS/MesJ|nr:tRNA 2-thiocytidine biosynthesis protein TtcA [Helicobacteraceae bacterium]
MKNNFGDIRDLGDLGGSKIPVAQIPKRIARVIAQANARYGLIGEGDRVIVGLSGGKDSLTLTHALLRMKRIAPFDFELLAITIDYGMGEDLSRLAAHCREYGVPHEIEKTSIFADAPKYIRENSSFCSYFSRMRRGFLYTAARNRGFNTLALAHHLDDAAESFFMNIFNNGKLRSMPVFYKSERGIKVIRPLIAARESWLADCAKANNFPIVGDENCPAFKMNVKMPHARAEMKERLAKLALEKEGAFDRLRRAFCNVQAETFCDERFLGKAGDEED